MSRQEITERDPLLNPQRDPLVNPGPNVEPLLTSQYPTAESESAITVAVVPAKSPKKKKEKNTSSKDISLSKADKAQLAFFLMVDAMNGGFGLSAMTFNISEGFPDYTQYFLLPTAFPILALTTFCSYKRTQSAIKDKDGSSSYIAYNIGIDFFTFYNFFLDTLAAAVDCGMGPEANNLPWSVSGTMFAGPAVLAAIYAYLAYRKHQNTLGFKGTLGFETFLFLQVSSAISSLAQLMTGINPITWNDFGKIFGSSAGVALVIRLLRDKYPVLYKIADDVIPLAAYLGDEGKLLSKRSSSLWTSLFFTLLPFTGLTLPIFALLRGKIPADHIKAVVDNPTLIPGKHHTMFGERQMEEEASDPASEAASEETPIPRGDRFLGLDP